MLKKIGLVAVLAALISVVVATTAWGSAKAPRTAAAATASVKCGKQVSIGVAYPATGGVAFLGVLQFDWAKYAVKRWNGSNKLKIKLVQGDTKLTTDAAANLAVAHSFASNGKVLAVTGPAGSQEVQDSAGVYHGAGLAPVSGSATRIFLTRAKPGDPRETSKGFFYRTVPNDGQQGDAVANYIHSSLKKKRVYIIDDEEAYSQGLADQVQADLKKFGVNAGRNHVAQNVSDFSSLIASIPNNTQLVYIPWQQAAEAQTFSQQLKANGRNATVMGSDGIDAPGQFEAHGAYVSGFPVDATSSAYKAFTKAHKGQPETFGLPTYTSVWANATAIKMACKAGHGKTTRQAVRKDLLKVKLTAKQSLLGFPVQFLNKNKSTFQGPGDMGGAADFAIYHITNKGDYVRVK
ncbi:MAG TPA: branched-chain amino acid ABC transporter substrate-binding protein [Gaiellaceae bacterium]|jgi:branched-chain amino acid transport system substrate-binding protein